jgi:spermidine synthase
MQDFINKNGTISERFVEQCHKLGHLLFWQKHGSLSVQVRQDKSLKWLLINDTLQSVVERDHPENLLCEHLQQLALIWDKCPQPNNVLELGLGAGAIRGYLRAKYPSCKVTSIDNNPDVVYCYKRYFNTEQTNSVSCQDANHALKQKQQYDWIILDLFSEYDAPLFLFKHDFYNQIRDSLTPNGWLFINFVAEHESQLKHLEHLLIANFGQKPISYSSPMYANHIFAVSR